MKKRTIFTLIFALILTNFVVFAEIPENIRESVVLKVGTPNAWIEGKVVKIDPDNEEVSPKIIDGRTLVPARFLSESFNAKVSWDEKTRSVSIFTEDKFVKMTLDNKELWVNGSEITMDVPAQSIEGRTMIPLRIMCENVLEKKVFWDESGLIVVSEKNHTLNSNKNKQAIKEITLCLENGEGMPEIPPTTPKSIEEPKNIKSDKIEEASYKVVSGDGMPYRLYVPESFDENKKYSMLLFLHGAGSRGDDNESQVTTDVKQFFTRLLTEKKYKEECIIIAPQCPTSDYWANISTQNGIYDYSKTSMSFALIDVMGVIREVRAMYPQIDEKRLYVTGLSMGGHGTWYLLAKYPDMFAAAVPICGSTDPNTAKTINKIPIWAFHSVDDTVVPYNGTEAMVNALKEVGGNIKFTSYSDAGHGSWVRAYAEPDLLDWMFSQSK